MPTFINLNEKQEQERIRLKKEIDCQIEELKKLCNEQINESGLEDIKKFEFICIKKCLYDILNRINELKK